MISAKYNEKTINKRVDGLKQEMICYISDCLQVCIPGYHTARFAVLIPPKDLKIYVPCQASKKQVVAIMMNKIIVKVGKKLLWYDMETMFTESLLCICNLLRNSAEVRCDKTGKYKRAINPWWFAFGNEEEINKNLLTVIRRSRKTYLESIQKKDGD